MSLVAVASSTQLLPSLLYDDFCQFKAVTSGTFQRLAMMLVMKSRD